MWCANTKTNMNKRRTCNGRGGHLWKLVFLLLPLPLLLPLLLLGVALAAKPPSGLPACCSPASGGLDWQAAVAASGTSKKPARATLADPAGSHQGGQDRRDGAQQQGDDDHCPRPAKIPGQIDHVDFPTGRTVWDEWKARSERDAESLRQRREDTRNVLEAWGWERRVSLCSSNRLLWAWFCAVTSPHARRAGGGAVARLVDADVSGQRDLRCGEVKETVGKTRSCLDNIVALDGGGRGTLKSRDQDSLAALEASIVKHGLVISEERSTRILHAMCHRGRSKGIMFPPRFLNLVLASSCPRPSDQPSAGIVEGHVPGVTCALVDNGGRGHVLEILYGEAPGPVRAALQDTWALVLADSDTSIAGRLARVQDTLQFVYVSGVSAGGFIIGLSEVYVGGSGQAVGKESEGTGQDGEGRDAEGAQEDQCGKDVEGAQEDAEGAHEDVLWIHQRVESGRCEDLDGSMVEAALKTAASRAVAVKGRISSERRKGRISEGGGTVGSGGHVPLDHGAHCSPKGRIISLDGVQGVVDLGEGRVVVSVPWGFPVDGEMHETAADRCMFEAYNLLQVILPVPYHRSFLTRDHANRYTRMIYVRDFRGSHLEGSHLEGSHHRLVGLVSATLQSLLEPDGGDEKYLTEEEYASMQSSNVRLYLGGFAVLPSFRGRGIGGLMLDSLIHRAKQGGLDSIHLHVDIGNRGAVKFYMRHGFQVRKTVAGFYAESLSSGIDPPDALYLVHDLGRDRQKTLSGQE